MSHPPSALARRSRYALTLDERHPYLFDVDREVRRQACVGQRTSVARRLILFLACSHDDAVLHHYKRRMSSRFARSRSWVSLDG